jgi:hypothetical protein
VATRVALDPEGNEGFAMQQRPKPGGDPGKWEIDPHSDVGHLLITSDKALSTLVATRFQGSTIVVVGSGKKGAAPHGETVSKHFRMFVNLLNKGREHAIVDVVWVKGQGSKNPLELLARQAH